MRFQSISRIVVTLGRVVLKNRMALLVYPAKSRKVLLIPMTKIDWGSCIHFQEFPAATRRITGCTRTFGYRVDPQRLIGAALT
ncbi:hypothetical protein ACP2AV_00115 [Aliiroseovarius sp. PTFE2010]|uniref:hypothetical protein n=1 Tax=Aliiroseovarius sp. PTFE2010 TaxID=3417190 RepID=UPI003CF0B69C